MSKSRLEINFTRLLDESQQMANGDKEKDWSFEKMMEGRSLMILYGSQTGTAQEVAERIGREAKRYYFTPCILPMNDVPQERLLRQNVIIFIAATTGQGDDPDNMKEFFSHLWSQRKNRLLLIKLKFAVLGLGDSSYQKFNFSAKRLNNLLCFLGGENIVKLALGDDQHDLGPDFVIDSWLEELWTKLLLIFPLPSGVEPLSSFIKPPPKYEVVFCEEYNQDISYDVTRTLEYDNLKLSSSTNPCFAKITRNDRLTALDHFQDVRLMEFDIKEIKESYKPGDVLMVQPSNLLEHVEEFISILGLDPDKKFILKTNDSNNLLPSSLIIPSPCSIRECVASYFDIQSIPKRYFFELLSLFTLDEQEKEKFQEFASAEGQQELFDYCNRPKRSIMEVLADFHNTRNYIPFEYLFDLIPSIKPRAYSIASSSIAQLGKAQILVAVVNYNTILKRPRLGLCTNWLSRLQNSTKVPVWIKPGTLTFPDCKSDNIPSVIMIGPGTGCAPFRSYIQERIATGKFEGLVLFFGCRSKNKDNFFADEWNSLLKENKLKLYSAFSRDQEDKIYVQHLMREAAEEVWEIIKLPSSRIYFAGNAKRVPIDVYEALLYICEIGLGGNKISAKQYMKNNLEKRYQTETWA